MVSRIFFLIMLLSFSFPSKGKSEVSHTPNNPFSSLDKIKKEEIPPFVLASNPNKEQALRDETNRMRKIGNEIFLLKDTNPEKFVREFDQYLGHMGKLAKKYPQNTHIENLKNEIGSGYLMLGLFTRFELGRPKEAIHFFKKIPLFLGNGFSGFYLIADTYFYDLNNRRKALSYYKRTLSTLEKTTKNREFALWMEDWIRHEIDFVKTGKPFSGTIGREIATAPLSFLLIGSIGEKAGTLGLDLDIEIGELLGDQPTKQESFLKQLQRLPRSHISLSAALISPPFPFR